MPKMVTRINRLSHQRAVGLEKTDYFNEDIHSVYTWEVDPERSARSMYGRPGDRVAEATVNMIDDGGTAQKLLRHNARVLAEKLAWGAWIDRFGVFPDDDSTILITNFDSQVTATYRAGQ